MTAGRVLWRNPSGKAVESLNTLAPALQRGEGSSPGASANPTGRQTTSLILERIILPKLKQKTTWLGLVSILASVIGLATGTLTPEIAATAIANGLGLIVADA